MNRFSLRLALASLAALGAVYAQAPEASFSISISTQQETVKVGEAIRLKVLITNTSTHEIRSYRDKSLAGELGGHRLVVEDETGTRPRMTRYHYYVRGQDIPADWVGDHDRGPGGITMSGGYAIIAPGQTAYPESILVSDLYDLRQPGKYFIHVERDDEESKTILKSNTLTITVTGPAANGQK